MLAMIIAKWRSGYLFLFSRVNELSLLFKHLVLKGRRYITIALEWMGRWKYIHVERKRSNGGRDIGITTKERTSGE